MVFSSGVFLFLFLPALLIVYYLVKNRSVRNYLLLLASLAFYAWGEPVFVFIMLASIFINWLITLIMSGASHKKFWLVLAITLDVLLLGVFKYAAFILENLAILAGHEIYQVNIALPIGISFFTFQSAGYVIDVWRRDIPAERNFVRYALFVSFFPQLVAGPIERSRNLLRQLDEPRPFDFDRAKLGVFLILWGLFLKMVLADRAAIFVDAAYANWKATNGMILMLATLLFAVQIYCDFYAYSIIAKGTAKILGIELMDNFCAPYFADSVQDFWRRWHISLSTWFRDYLYIPLGGSRCGTPRALFNIITVMLVSGIWHGAGLHFVAWGLFHGVLQAAEKIAKPVLSFVPKSLRWLGTTFWVCAAWVFFRASSVKMACKMLKKMAGAVAKGRFFCGEELYAYGLDAADLHLLCTAILLLFAADFCKYKGVDLPALAARRNPALQAVAIALAVTLISIYGIWGSAYNAAGFIYFQF